MTLPLSGPISLSAIANNNSSASLSSGVSLQTESVRFASASVVGDVDGNSTSNETSDRTALRVAPHLISEFRGANFPSSIITGITFATEGSDTNTVDGENLGVTFTTNGQSGTYTVKLIDSSGNSDSSTTRSGAGTVTFSNLNLTADTYRPQVEFNTFNVVNDNATFTHFDQLDGEQTQLNFSSANVSQSDQVIPSLTVTPSVSTGTQTSSSVSVSTITNGDGGAISVTPSLNSETQVHTMTILNTPGVLRFTSFHSGNPSKVRNNATSSADLTVTYSLGIDDVATFDGSNNSKTQFNSGDTIRIKATSEGAQSNTMRMGFGTANNNTTYTENSDKSISDTRFVRSEQTFDTSRTLTSGTSLETFFPKANYTAVSSQLTAGSSISVAPAYSYSTPGDATINVNTTRALDVSSVVGNNSSVAITSSPNKGSGTNTATFSPGTLNDVYTITYQGTANFSQTSNQTDTITVNPTVSVARSATSGNPTTDADGVSINSTSHGISPTTFTFTPTTVGTSLGFTYSMASGFSFTSGNANTAGAIQGTFNSTGTKNSTLEVASNGTSASTLFSVALASISKNFDSAACGDANAGGFRAGGTVTTTLQVDFVKRARLERQLSNGSFEAITGTTTVSHGGGTNQSGNTTFTINSNATVDLTQRTVRVVDVDRTANKIDLPNEDTSSSTYNMLAVVAAVDSFAVTPSTTTLRSILIDWATTNASTVTLKRADNSGMTTNLTTLVDASSDVDGDFTDTSVVNGITYFYRLTATNASNEGTNSSVVSGASISPSISFGTFSNATFNKGATGNITFNITPNFSSPEVDVKMVRTSNGTVFETDSNVGITKDSATGITFSQVNATLEGARYEAEIYETGTSTLLVQSGDQITVNSAVPAAPSSVSITDAGAGKVNFSFTDNANNETRFRAQAINNNNSQQEGSDATINTTNSAGTGVSYSNQGLVVTDNNNFYFGRVRAERVVTNDFTSTSVSSYVNSPVIEVGTAPESIGSISLDQSSYITGEQMTISYSTGNLESDETITIKLMSGTTTHTTFTTSKAGNSTSDSPTLGTSLSTASNYFIRIHKTGDTGVTNDSSNFTITATSVGVSTPSDVSETESGTYTRDHTFTISNPNPDGANATLSVSNVGIGSGIGNSTSGEGFSYAHSTSGFGSLSSQTTGGTTFSSFTGTNIFVRHRFIFSTDDENSYDGRIDTSLSYNGKSASDSFDYSLEGCFDLDTLILMSDNTTKKLRDIETGDVVKTWSILDMPNTDDKDIYMNWSTDTISGSSEVTASVVATNLGHSHSDYWYINSGSNSEFKVSDSHGIFIKDSSDNYKFKYASNLTTDDKLFDVNLNEVDIVNIEQMSGSIDTGWIDVESVDVNYYAGILAHNKCFVEGTLVTLWGGSQKPIEQIEVDDIIMSYDVVTNSVVRDVITNVIKPIHDDIIDIKFENDTINSNTFDHPYYVLDKGWSSYKPELTKLRYGIDTEQIMVGDVCLYGKDLEKVRIESITENIGERQTYTLEGTTGVNTFFANGIVVHNESK